MKIFITGANGMLGCDVIKLLRNDKNYELQCSDINGPDYVDVISDITNYQSIKNSVEAFNPDIIIHLAAETDLEKCEIHPEHAHKVHVTGTDHIIQLCKKHGITLVHLSTASVFDGKKEEGSNENDIPNPLNVYGKTKLEAENNVRNTLDKYFILRPAWMVGGIEKDKKFVRKIVEQIELGNDIRAVEDIKGNLSYTRDVARAILYLLKTKYYGIYHAVNEGIVSRYDIAKKIVSLYGNPVKVIPVSSTEYQSIVVRPRIECLQNNELFALEKKRFSTWDFILSQYISDYKKEYEVKKRPAGP